MTILSAVQAVCNHPAVGEPAPTSGVSSSDPLIQQIVGLIGIEARELRSRHNWTGLITPATLTLGAPGALGVITQTLPADFHRFVQNGSLYHVGQRRDAIGPLSSDDWLSLTRNITPVANAFWRKRGNFIDFIGAAQADVVAYEYITSSWAATQAGAPLATPASDTDVLLLPEELVVLGAVWRYRSAKGYDYSQEVDAYEGEFSRAVAADKGAVAPISLTSRASPQYSFLITP